MAELLIRLKNNTHSDPAKDLMCYKRGDIVVVKSDGHHWGSSEGLPDFAVIGTDRTVARIEQFLAIHEVSKTITTTLPLAQWWKMKATGNLGRFTSMPTEGVKKIRMVNYGTPRQQQITTIELTGPVMRPHTRRRWGVALGMLPVQEAKDLAMTGRAVIAFTQLRIAMKDKITGAQA